MVRKSKFKEGQCWNCGAENHGEKCTCGATQDKPPKLGQSPLGQEIELTADCRVWKTRTPAAVKYNEFKMPQPAKQPGRKPIKNQPTLL